MVRKVAGIAACILFLGLVAFSVAAWAQEHSQGATRSLTFGERLERLRRNIVGGEESPAEHHAHHHRHSSQGSTPRMASSAPRSASSGTKSFLRQGAIRSDGFGASVNATISDTRPTVGRNVNAPHPPSAQIGFYRSLSGERKFRPAPRCVRRGSFRRSLRAGRGTCPPREAQDHKPRRTDRGDAR